VATGAQAGWDREPDAGRRYARVAAFIRFAAAGRGESVKALSGYLGHSNPGFTLRVYTHLLPTSHERTRGAIAAFFGELLDADKKPGRDQAA
jgi:integrase